MKLAERKVIQERTRREIEAEDLTKRLQVEVWDAVARALPSANEVASEVLEMIVKELGNGRSELNLYLKRLLEDVLDAREEKES